MSQFVQLLLCICSKCLSFPHLVRTANWSVCGQWNDVFSAIIFSTDKDQVSLWYINPRSYHFQTHTGPHQKTTMRILIILAFCLVVLQLSLLVRQYIGWCWEKQRGTSFLASALRFQKEFCYFKVHKIRSVFLLVRAAYYW